MNNNELFKIEQHKLKLTNWEEEFKYYLSQNIETNLELYVIEKKWYEDYKKAVFSNTIKGQTKINNYNYFQPMDNSHIIYSQNTINPDSNFILLNKDCMNSFSPNITNSKSNLKIKLVAHFSNNKMISKIGNSLYYFYYLDEDNIIREGFFIFGEIESNKIDSIINNFLNSNINGFIKHYFKGINPNRNKSGKSILYHLDDFDFIIKINENDYSNNFNICKINNTGRMKNINNIERNIGIVNITTENNKKSKNKKKGNGYRWSSSSPKRNNQRNNNLIINLNINNNIQNFNVRNHRSYEKKNKDNIIDCICEYFYSEREYQSFINQPKKFSKSFIPINKFWLNKFLSKYSYEKIEKDILMKNSNLYYKKLINQYLYQNKQHDIEINPIPSIQENEKNGYKYYDNYKLITKESYNIFKEVFGQEKANKEFNLYMIDYNYIFIQYNNISAEIQIKNGLEKYIIYSNILKEIRNNILGLGLVDGISKYGVHLDEKIKDFSKLKLGREGIGIIININPSNNDDDDDDIINNDENVYTNDIENKDEKTNRFEENLSNRSKNTQKVKVKSPRFNAKVKLKNSPAKCSLKKNVNNNLNPSFINNSKKYEDNIEANNLNNEKMEEPMDRSPNINMPRRNISKIPNIQQYNRNLHMKNDLAKNNNISYSTHQQQNITKIEDENQNKFKTPIVKVKKMSNYKLPVKQPNNLYKNNFKKNIPNNKLYKSKEYEEHIETKTKGLVGLANIGATCYMNATIQCFSNIQRFRDELLDKDVYKDLYNNRNHAKRLSFALAEVFKNLWLNNSINYYSPDYFKEVISNMNSLFKGIAANDSKDLILFILETMHNELNICTQREFTKNVNNLDFPLVFKEFEKYYKQNNKTIVSDEFYGFYNSMMKCCSCNTVTHNVQIMNILFFPLENVRKFIHTPYNFVTLDNCFEYYEAPELLKDNNQIFCNYCNRDSIAYSQSKIIIAPNTLIINLNRGKGLQFNVGIQFKEIVDLSKFIFYNQSSPHCYELVGVISHLGTSDMGGHFIAFCKNSCDCQWYKYNDAQVNLSSFKEITSIGLPYVLYYSYIKA